MSSVDFDARLRRISRKHRRMAGRGVIHRVGPDGLMVEQPRGAGLRFPWRMFVLMAVMAFGFKLWLFLSLGAVDYAARVERLAGGNMGEQAAAWLLQPEPATLYLAGQIGGLR